MKKFKIVDLKNENFMTVTEAAKDIYIKQQPERFRLPENVGVGDNGDSEIAQLLKKAIEFNKLDEAGQKEFGKPVKKTAPKKAAPKKEEETDNITVEKQTSDQVADTKNIPAKEKVEVVKKATRKKAAAKKPVAKAKKPVTKKAAPKKDA